MGDVPKRDPYEEFTSYPFPGKRLPANRNTSTVPTPTSAPVWDSKPKTYLHGGQDREFFQISALAEALGCSVVTIRSWENKGLLPRTPYRTPVPEGPGRRSGSTGGTATKGRRLWTREQIEGILDICNRLGVITDPKRTTPTKEFSLQVTQLFIGLLKEEGT